jgi:hypothetical protein
VEVPADGYIAGNIQFRMRVYSSDADIATRAMDDELTPKILSACRLIADLQAVPRRVALRLVRVPPGIMDVKATVAIDIPFLT